MKTYRRKNRSRSKLIIGVLVFVVVVYLFGDKITDALSSTVEVGVDGIKKDIVEGKVAGTTTNASIDPADVVDSTVELGATTHILTPAEVKGIYMTSWVAGTESMKKHILNIIDTTEVNSVIIDIKDYTGKISFKTGDTKIDDSGCVEERIKDIKNYVKELHDKNIYVIGRVSVFQDPCFVAKHPEVAVKRKSDGGIWKDRKGISWVDMGSKEAWDNAVHIARVSYELGFDEINFDYVRFPSDGDMQNISFISGSRAKADVFRDFFQYLDKELRGGKGTLVRKTIPSSTATSTSTGKLVTTPASVEVRATDPVFDEHYSLITSSDKKYIEARQKIYNSMSGEGRVILSADLFGLVTSQKDDMGIGQVLENALPYVDYVAPMVYPSHYPATWNGYKNPAANPYEVIKVAMGDGVKRTKEAGLNPQKLRPWLQDFDMGATYTAEMVRAQMKATYEVGLSSWMLWDASNKYTPTALLSATQ